ncbi:MAG: hypothetical protein R3326_01630 [Gemmatimonadota bacterium]|nr:hypothetical protein [Gemmatimonadota bacterium]
MRRLGCLFPLAAILVGIVAGWAYLRQDYRDRFARRAGELVAVHDSTGVGYGLDGKLVTDVTLVSDTGLEVLLRVRAPDRWDGTRRPAVILVGGFRTGRRAAQVPEESADLVLASVEYPYDGPRRGLSSWEWARRVPALRDAALETPSALLLAAQYLYAREDVDPERVTIVGASLGVPFAVAAAATDRRLAGAALLHGGGDLGTLFGHAYRDEFAPGLVPVLGALLEWATAPLEPTRYVDEIAPRPLLMINSSGDAMVPTGSVEALYEAAREPKRLIWFETPHVGTDQDATVEALMGLTLEWMEERGLR